MKVYFGAAANQLDEFRNEYKKIMEVITDQGHEVLTTHDVLHVGAAEIFKDNSVAFSDIYHRWQTVVRQADIAVIEASYPSSVMVGTGIAALVERGKPTIVLYVSGRDPIFTNEIYSSRLIKVQYSQQTLDDVLPWALDEAKQWMERRFTMIIPGDQDSYIDMMSKKKQVSRSEYIRDLIKQDMDK
jgi:hypothetical protein